MKSFSHVQLLATPWTAAYQAPLSSGILQARVLEWGAIAFYNSKYRFLVRPIWLSQVALAVKKLPANAGDKRKGLDPWSGRSPAGEGHGKPLQYSCLENPMERGAWQNTVHRVTKSQILLKQVSMHTRKIWRLGLLESKRQKDLCTLAYVPGYVPVSPGL